MSVPKQPCIVVAYDGSQPARAAVRYAASQAGPGGRVIVVHAFGLPSEWFGAAVAEPIVAEQSERGRAILDDLLMTDGDCLLGLDFDVELVGGDPAKTVTTLAEINDADEIVVGSRGRGRIEASLLGSVAQDIVHRANRPVVVIPYAAAQAQDSEAA